MSSPWTPASVVVTSMFLAVVIFIGIFGNILVIIVSYRRTRIKTKGNAVIGSLAVADLLESLNMIFMLVSLAHFGDWIFGDFICQLNAFLTVEFVMVSMFNLAVISVNRYFMVVKPNLYKKVFSKRNQTVILVCIWTYPLIFAIAPLIGWSSFEFQAGKCVCIFFFSESVSYTIALVISVVPIPLSIICYTCYKIFREVKHHQTRIRSMASQAPKMNVEEVKITKTLVVVIGAYLVCFLPAAAVNLVEMLRPNYKIPLWIDIISMVLVFSNHANNPLIYGVFNKQYRRAFKEVALDAVRALGCAKLAPADPEDSTTSFRTRRANLESDIGDTAPAQSLQP